MNSRTAVSFANNHGETLYGTRHGGIGKVMVIGCHDLLQDQNGEEQLTLAAALEGAGLPFLRFSFAGCGQSDGSLFDTSYSRRVDDLDAAINFVCRAGAQHVVVFGARMGGSVAYLAAARDERIVGVATLSASARPALLLGRPGSVCQEARRGAPFTTSAGMIGPQFFDDSEAHDVVAAVAILRASIFVVHGECDMVVPASEAHDLATAAPCASLELVCGADHAFSQGDHRRAAMRRVADFVATATTTGIFK